MGVELSLVCFRLVCSTACDKLRLGKSYGSITHCLAKESYTTPKAGVYKFVRRYEETVTIWRRPGSGLAKKLTAEGKRIVDEYRRSTVRAYGRSMVHAYGGSAGTGVRIYRYGRSTFLLRAY